jgi:beta-N-acetylhexosaminidase
MSINRRQFVAGTSLALALPRMAYGKALYPAERIAPIFMVGFEGTSPQATGAQELAEQIAENKVGGVCFIYKNAASRQGVEGLTRLFHSAADAWPMFMAIDQEGGQVQRLSSHLGYDSEPSPISVATSFDVMTARRTYAAMAAEMRSAGFNLNLAPVVDLGFEAHNPAITRLGRSFGAEPGTVIKYSRAFLAGHRDEGVLTALKHFPGHGSSLADSHDGAADVTKTWRESELAPYASLVREGAVQIVMTGHISHKDLTGGLPASLSAQAIGGLLRGKVGYNGVVITDDLDMAAVRRTNSLEDAAVKAAAAGNDILLFTNGQSDPEMPLKLIRAIQQAILDGRLKAEQIEASVARIAALKLAFQREVLLPREPREL